MATFTSVDYDPFAAPQQAPADTGSGPLRVTVKPQRKFTPVDYDPFAQPNQPSQPNQPVQAPNPVFAETEEDVRRLEQQMQPQVEPPSQWRSGGLGALQGMTFNFGDELAGGVNAGIDYITGQAPNGIGQAYEARLASARRQIAEAEKANPGTFLAGQVGGGIATLPFTPVRAGVAGGMATGAMYGALSGAGAGEGLAGRAAGAGIGAGVGGAVGAAVPVVIGGVTAAARGISNAASNGTAIARGIMSPETEAARRIENAISRDASSLYGKNMDAAGLARAQQGGQPVRVVDMGGETTRALARSSANTSPEGRQVLEKTAQDRFQTQGARAVEFVQKLIGTVGDAGARLISLQAAARAANRARYARPYAEGASGVWDSTLARMASAPAMVKAIRDATRRSANKAAADGFKPVLNPFVVGADDTIAMKAGMSPSLEFWDVVKQNLDDQIEAAARAGEKGERAILIELRNAMRDHLDNLIPSYAAARKGAAAAFGAEDALEAGQKFVSSSMSNHDARRQLAKMSKPERALFAEGFASELIEKINATSDKRNVINQIWSTPRARERIYMALGKERGDQVEAFVRVENIMDMLRTALGNSTTVRQMTEAGMAGGAVSYYQGEFSLENMMIGGLMAQAFRRGTAKIDEKVARKVAEMLASDDPAMVQRAAAMVAKNKPLMQVVKDTEDRLTKALSAPINDNVAQPVAQALVPGMRSAASAPEQQREP